MRLEVSVPLGFTFKTEALSALLGVSEEEVLRLHRGGELVGRLAGLGILELLAVTDGKFHFHGDLSDEEVRQFRAQLGLAPQAEEG